MFHLAKPDYHRYAKALKLEQQVYLNNMLSEKEWDEKNLGLMLCHNYFTEYGLTVLATFKALNKKIIEIKLGLIK